MRGRAANTENTMGNQAGIWIDHRRAVIVELTPDGEVVKTIESHVQKHPQRGGDSPMKGTYEARQVPADDSRQRALTGELDRYYDAVIAALPEKDNLLVLGPGEAKAEFRTRLSKLRPRALVSAIEAADKMTEHQIIVKCRAHFGRPAKSEV
jgi:hypothetical protein